MLSARLRERDLPHEMVRLKMLEEVARPALPEVVERVTGTHLTSMKNFTEDTLPRDSEDLYEPISDSDFDDDDVDTHDDEDDDQYVARVVGPPPAPLEVGPPADTQWEQTPDQLREERLPAHYIVETVSRYGRLRKPRRYDVLTYEDRVALCLYRRQERRDIREMRANAARAASNVFAVPSVPITQAEKRAVARMQREGWDSERAALYERDKAGVSLLSRVWEGVEMPAARGSGSSPLKGSEVVLTIQADRNDEYYVPRSKNDIWRITDVIKRQRWIDALQKEIDSFMLHKVFTPVPRAEVPEGTRIHRGIWVFDRKTDGTCKARYTIDGSGEEINGPGDVYAGVVRKESLRAALYTIATTDMHAEVLDFKSAYLQGTARKPVYALPADIYGEWKGHVWSITGNIYGLRTAARVWKEKLHSILSDLGLCQMEKDDSVYYMRNGDVFSLVIVYVDDCIFASTSEEWMSDFKTKLDQRHSVSFKGDLHDNTFLNIRMRRDREGRTITLDLQDYIEEVCEKHLSPALADRPGGLRRVDTPVSKAGSHALITSGEERSPHPEYPQIVGSLNYISMVCRPDLAVTVCKLSRHMFEQNGAHLDAAERALRYLHATRHEVLVIGGDEVTTGKVRINVWTDSDWGTDPGDSVSYTGALVRIGNTPIYWKSCKQKAIARSSTEAELYALNTGTRECMWLAMFLQELGFEVEFPIQVHCDNSGAICISNGSVTGLHRHVRHNIHYPRDLVEKGFIKVDNARSQDMLADGLTKELPRAPFQDFRRKLNMRLPTETMPA